MSANHALGGARVHVRLRTELAYQMCSQCHGLYPSIAECVCVYCEATVCPSCVELLEDIDEVVCLSCVEAGGCGHPQWSGEPSAAEPLALWPAIVEKRTANN
jgi:hypothetical protein